MPVGVFDNFLHKDIFATARMRELFADSNTVQQWLNVEAALARVQGRMGIIPEVAASEIERKARYDLLDVEAFVKDLKYTGHPFVPLVNALARICDGDAGEYVHWGATTQDIMDTALVLQLRDASSIIREGVAGLVSRLKDLSVEHRDSLMVGRTNGQHALPMTLGFKLARWAVELERSLQRIDQTLPRLLVGQFSGAVGTLASFGEFGSQVQAELMAALDLNAPDITWHSSRDSLQEIVSVLGILAASVGQMADELYAMQKPELDEVSEQMSQGSVGSSTMPQKRNPFHTMEISALCRLVSSTAAQLMTMPGHDGERDARALLVEYDLVPRSFIMLDAALVRMNDLLGSLQFNTQALRSRVDGSAGLIGAERIMMHLATVMGRLRAHSLVHRLAAEARDSGQDFKELLLSAPELSDRLSRRDVESLLDPSTYTGQSGAIVDRIDAHRGVGNDHPAGSQDRRMFSDTESRI